MDSDGGKRRSRTVRYVSWVVVSGVLGVVFGVVCAKVGQEPVSVPLCAGLGVCFGVCSAVSCFLESRLRKSWVARVCYMIITALAIAIGSTAGNLAYAPQTSGVELIVKAIPGVLCGVIFGAVGLTIDLTKHADD